MGFSKSYFNKIKSLDFNDFITHLIRHYVCPFYINNSKKWLGKETSNKFNKELEKFNSINLGYKNTDKLSNNFDELILALNNGNAEPTFFLALFRLGGNDYLRLRHLRQGIEIIQNMEDYVLDEVLTEMLSVFKVPDNLSDNDALKTNICMKINFMFQVFGYAKDDTNLQLETLVKNKFLIISDVSQWALISKFLGKALYYYLLIKKSTIQNGLLSTTFNHHDVYFMTNLVEAITNVSSYAKSENISDLKKKIEYEEMSKTEKKRTIKKGSGQIENRFPLFALVYLMEDSYMKMGYEKSKYIRLITIRATRIKKLKKYNTLKSDVFDNRARTIKIMLKGRKNNFEKYPAIKDLMENFTFTKIANLLVTKVSGELPDSKIRF